MREARTRPDAPPWSTARPIKAKRLLIVGNSCNGALSCRWKYRYDHQPPDRRRRHDLGDRGTLGRVEEVCHHLAVRRRGPRTVRRPIPPRRPVHIRALYEVDAAQTAIVVWDGEGITTHANTYAWFMTLRGGKVVDGTAFYDSIAFNELWHDVTPTR